MPKGAETSRFTSIPGSIACALRRLRTKSPAAISSNSESATSTTTKTFLTSSRRPGSLPPLLVRSAGPMIGRDAASAGTAPHTIPVRPESSSANVRTRRSIAKSSGSGSAPAGGGAAANA